MNRPDVRWPWSARALALLLLLTAGSLPLPARAATVCVDTVNEFVAAVQAAEDQEQTVNVVAGTYAFSSSPLQFGDEPDHRLEIAGGWNANCTARQLDPRATVFTGTVSEFGLFVQGDSLRIESVAFIGMGRVGLNARDEHLTLERVWFADLCEAGAGCPDYRETTVNLLGDTVHLSHVVATALHGYECAISIGTDLDRASVLFSVFAANEGHALCLTQQTYIGFDLNPDYELEVFNSIFWNNAGHDLFTRDSPHLTLKNNIYQSIDTSPGPETSPVQTLDVDPQFQNQAGRDFRPQPSSPAINTGRFGTFFPDRDLVGSDRVIGPAPDRGAFESASSESTFQVTNTVDTLSPVSPGSLRWAIEQANATPGLDRIRFALPGCPGVIELNALLPDITDSVFIDGYSQAGSARNASSFGFAPTLCVGLRDSALALDHALRIPAGAADSTLLWVSGLAFGGFDVAAVRIAAGSNSWIFGNQFGGSLGGTALGNNAVNVRLGGTSHDNLVGGLEYSQRNLIASAYSAGIELLDNSAGDEGYANAVRNNLIGLQANGRDAAPNAIGVRVRSLRNEIVDNHIAGNQSDGILLEGELAFRNEIRDNRIGLKTFAFCLPPCTPDYALGNGGAGVRLTGAGLDNDILDNRIAHNGGAGVRLEEGMRNFVWDNSITANDGLGIDIGAAGVNPQYNTGLVVTGGYANRGVNAPALTAAAGDGTGGSVSGQIAGRNGLHRVQVFRNASCDASGRGEGTELLLSSTVSIGNALPGANGTASFTFPLPANTDLTGDTLSATLTDGDGNTSEFSACLDYATVQCREIFRDGLEDNPPPLACTPL
jgi:hypothetical protein